MRSLAEAGSWQDLWPCGEKSPCRSPCSDRTCHPMRDPCWNSLFLKDSTLWEGPTLVQFMKNCSP